MFQILIAYNPSNIWLVTVSNARFIDKVSFHMVVFNTVDFDDKTTFFNELWFVAFSTFVLTDLSKFLFFKSDFDKLRRLGFFRKTLVA